MHLLGTNADDRFSLTSFVSNNVPSYAILSHTWEGNKGYRKIKFCNEHAKMDGLEYFWIDSCCIDKTNAVELAEAINSMFRWYRKAAKCYVYLSDVSTANTSMNGRDHLSLRCSDFHKSRWFRRGWTLQELLAPSTVEFYSQDGDRLGDKESLQRQILKATSIPALALQGNSLAKFSLNERLSWMANRETTIDEDFVYCLLGIFQVHIPLIYGERVRNAFSRLLREVDMRSRDTHLQPVSSNYAKIGGTPLHLATRLGLAIFVKLLLEDESDVNAKDENGWTALSWAAKEGHELIVKLLIDAKADVNLKGGNSQTAPSRATEEGHKRNANLKEKHTDKNTRTPLSWAAGKGHVGIVIRLIEAKADVNLVDDSGQAALLLAAKKGYEFVVGLLLNSGMTNVDAKDQRGRTALSWAAERGHAAVVKLLLDIGKATADTSARLGPLMDFWGVMRGRKPLSYAADNGHEAVVRLLLNTGNVNVNAVSRGQTALLLAAKNGHEAVVRLLLDSGKIHVDAKGISGRTALSWAAENGHEKIVKLLIKFKIDVKLNDDSSRAALLIAAKTGYQAVVELLLLDTDNHQAGGSLDPLGVIF